MEDRTVKALSWDDLQKGDGRAAPGKPAHTEGRARGSDSDRLSDPCVQLFEGLNMAITQLNSRKANR